MLYWEVGTRKVCSASRLQGGAGCLGRGFGQGLVCLGLRRQRKVLPIGKGPPGWYCEVIKQPLPLLRKPHGGSREPKRRTSCRGLGSDAKRQ